MAIDHEAHLERVRKYDPGADADVVKALVRRLNIVLQNRDAVTVACSDEDELKRIRDGFAKKTLDLGASHDDAAIMSAIQEVCVQMADARGSKHRVPFYYLLAKNTGTLDKL
ncbi:DUF2853 family protein [Parvularcula dongshanensis]|uniref:DUF2853 family protein n=1 Tax=Parvularcula dongshanensis TaxID=1173995 RepID=A0A840I1A4_9PROT|nr:DUF2853 family protein [Parvularcula dongshanensis]MBB4657978.1 hypothetical protein [Parvularcula dongshanensis]